MFGKPFLIRTTHLQVLLYRVGQGFWVYSTFGNLISGSTVFLCLTLGIKHSLTTNFGYKVYRVFLNFGILHEF